MVGEERRSFLPVGKEEGASLRSFSTNRTFNLFMYFGFRYLDVCSWFGLSARDYLDQQETHPYTGYL